MNIEIVPGILEKEWGRIEEKLELVRPFAKTVHIDLLDGKFAPNTTFLDPTPFKKYKDDFLLELHMMVEEPIHYVKPFAQAGFKRFVGHIERMSDQAEFVAQTQMVGEVVLAIDGKTSLDEVKVPYDDLDGILVMTIHAGFSGQKFMPEHLEKVKVIRSKGLFTNFGEPFPIEVDGGINDETIKLAKDAGASRFVATSFIFKEEPQNQFQILQNACGH